MKVTILFGVIAILDKIDHIIDIIVNVWCYCNFPKISSWGEFFRSNIFDQRREICVNQSVCVCWMACRFDSVAGVLLYRLPVLAFSRHDAEIIKLSGVSSRKEVVVLSVRKGLQTANR